MYILYFENYRKRFESNIYIYIYIYINVMFKVSIIRILLSFVHMISSFLLFVYAIVFHIVGDILNF